MYNFARYSSGQKATGFGIPAARVIASSRATSPSVAALSATRSGRDGSRIVPASAHRRLAAAPSFPEWFRKGKRSPLSHSIVAICRVVCRSAMQTQGNRTVRRIFRRYYQFRLIIGLGRFRVDFHNCSRGMRKFSFLASPCSLAAQSAALQTSSFDSRLTQTYLTCQRFTMKARLLLSLLVAGLLCNCATTDSSTRTEQTSLPQMPPQPPAPLQPAHN